jgi:ribosomal protein S18 acetylase RimI-like enzyme
VARMLVRDARPADAAAMARVFVDSFHAGHRGQMPDWLIGTRTYAASERGWARTMGEMADGSDPARCLLVAEDAEQGIVGVAMGGPPKPWAADEDAPAREATGELYALYVDPRQWRRGVGRALLGAVAARLAAAGRPRLLVGVLAANAPARRFYEAAGGRLLGQRPFDDEGVLFDEAVYVWAEGAGPAPTVSTW